jgi:hypothetical protein
MITRTRLGPIRGKGSSRWSLAVALRGVAAGGPAGGGGQIEVGHQQGLLAIRDVRKAAAVRGDQAGGGLLVR